jgi:hypothetical protein
VEQLAQVLQALVVLLVPQVQVEQLAQRVQLAQVQTVFLARRDHLARRVQLAQRERRAPESVGQLALQVRQDRRE